MRKKRSGEHTCSCDAYCFPHRFGGGKCSGIHIAQEAYYGGDPVCFSCPEFSEQGCAVIDGREELNVCDAYINFVELNEVK